MIRWSKCTILGMGCALAFSSSLSARADWPFFAKEGQPLRGTPEYNQLHSADPPGARQVYKHGKLWPPQPRPVGPHGTFMHKYHHSHYWPYPYNCQDRASVHALVNVQVANGWQQHTTLYDYHFDPVSNELNSSGRSHLNWILFNVPPEHQQVTVATANEPARTSARMSNVQREVAQLAGANPGFPIQTRRSEAFGRPAGEVQAIFTSAMDNMPPPILSQTAGDAGGGNAQ